jgi:hypothetical protein
MIDPKDGFHFHSALLAFNFSRYHSKHSGVKNRAEFKVNRSLKVT